MSIRLITVIFAHNQVLYIFSIRLKKYFMQRR